MKIDQLGPAFEKQMKTFNRSMSIFKQSIVAAGIAIGAQLAPAFAWMAQKISGLMVWFTGLSDGLKKFIAWGLLGVALLAGLFIAAAVAVAFFGAAFGVVAGAIFSMSALIALGWIALVAVIIAAGVAIWAFWDDIKGIVGKVGSFLGFGDELSADEIKGSAELNQNNKTEVEVGLKAPKNTIDYVKMRTTGDTTGLKTGMSMETG
jgi:hypothetical protein